MSLFLYLLGLFALTNGKEYLLIDKFKMDFLNLENEMWTHILWDTSQFDSAASEMYLIDQLTEFDEQFQKMPDDIINSITPLKYTDSFIEVNPELIHIDRLYVKFRQYLKDQKELVTVSKKTIENSIDSDEMTRDINSIKSGVNATKNIIDKILPNLFHKLLEIEVTKNDHNDNFQSVQQMYYNVYNVVALRDLKAYIMMEYTYLIDQILSNGREKYYLLAENNRKYFEATYKETLSRFRKKMLYTSSKFWRTDPENHSKGSTYDEFTRLLQGHIQNEVDMNGDRTCRKTCSDYSMTVSYGCYDRDSDYCRSLEKCGGRIIGCKFIESDMTICPPRSKNRRYEFIKFDGNKYYGQKTNCWAKTVESWHRWFVHCSYCRCLCDEPNIFSDRFINLRPVHSDVKNNKIVTGIKFVKDQRILHVQIQEGQLLPGGHVNQSTLRWVPIDSYKITDQGVYRDEDFFQMSYEYRSMGLDYVKTKLENYVVTGIKFNIVDHTVRLSVYFNKIDWNNGIVLANKSEYIQLTNFYNMEYVEFDRNVDIPISGPKSYLINGDNKLVKFRPTGFDADAAQTTIPYIDIQPVYNKPAVPLNGIQVGFKENNPYGGFITPVIYTYNYGEKLLVSKFPDLNTQQRVLPKIMDS